ncbi:hypothetical protein QJS66_22855 [Kocuria rhizophila]|nr:hypothetical protein QJS66_22855 [Kocuria rhizophila]
MMKRSVAVHRKSRTRRRAARACPRRSGRPPRRGRVGGDLQGRRPTDPAHQHRTASQVRGAVHAGRHRFDQPPGLAERTSEVTWPVMQGTVGRPGRSRGLRGRGAPPPVMPELITDEEIQIRYRGT